jgi:arylsulfatase A
MGLVPRVAALLLLVAVGCSEPAPEQQDPVNIVFILADDLGWADVGYNGSTFYQTPHIDALSERGMVFTDAYSASPVCSPTRAALLTGKHPARLHMTCALGPKTIQTGKPVGPATSGDEKAKLWPPVVIDRLPTEETTIAERLREAGYATGLVGKWHVGMIMPHEHGFDRFLAANPLGVPQSYFPPYGISTLRDGPAGEYLTDRLTDEAIRFIEQNQDGPFLLYLSHFAPHAPWEGKPGLVAKYQALVDPEAGQNNPVYAAMIESLDDSVGRIVARLEELGLSENTAVIFTSDNGAITDRRLRRKSKNPVEYHITSNAPLRAGKGKMYEGGLRVPLIVDWPGVTTPGTSSADPVVSMDLYPTFLSMAGQTPATLDLDVDGLDLTPLLSGAKQSLGREALYFHLPHQTMVCAVRRGNDKLVHHFSGSTELFDLGEDIGEERDLAPAQAAEAEDLRDELFAWLERVGAHMPVENPGF